MVSYKMTIEQRVAQSASAPAFFRWLTSETFLKRNKRGDDKLRGFCSFFKMPYNGFHLPFSQKVFRGLTISQ